jgi:hypothetical protein
VSVRCAICGKECNAAFLRLGGYCGEEHRREVLRRHHQRLDELRREELRAVPELLTVPDFERLALKLAVHLLAAMSPQTRLRYERQAPELLDPLELAAELKARILPQFPGGYAVLQEAVGHQRLFYDGTYSFPQPVPARVVLEAMERAKVLPPLP